MDNAAGVGAGAASGAGGGDSLCPRHPGLVPQPPPPPARQGRCSVVSWGSRLGVGWAPGPHPLWGTEAIPQPQSLMVGPRGAGTAQTPLRCGGGSSAQSQELRGRGGLEPRSPEPVLSGGQPLPSRGQGGLRLAGRRYGQAGWALKLLLETAEALSGLRAPSCPEPGRGMGDARPQPAGGGLSTTCGAARLGWKGWARRCS